MARVLVTYATMFGSTAEIAERIGARLTVAGFDVDVLHANEGIDLRKYDAVVAGSPMYGNKWLSDAALLLYANTETLSNIPLAIFSIRYDRHETCGRVGSATSQLLQYNL